MRNKPKLNPQQEVAVDAELRLPAIVTAAAGSGKTFVLVERVIGLICDRSHDTSIDTLAIMTFTRNATRSMRQKLNKAFDEKLEEINEKIAELTNTADASKKTEIIKLEDDYTYIKDQKFRLRRTNISTINAFCLKMIKENIELFDLPVNFTLADDARKAAFQFRAINLAMQDFYNETGSFTEEERNTLFHTFSFESDSELQKAIIKFENDLSTYVDADKWLDKAQDVYKDEESLKEQYFDTLAAFIDAYFCRSTDPAGRKGVIQNYFEKYDKIIDKIKIEGDDLIQNYTHELDEMDARGATKTEKKSVSDKLNSAKKLVDDIVPKIENNVEIEKAGYNPVYDAYEAFKSSPTIPALYAVFEAIKKLPKAPESPRGGASVPSKTLITANKKYGAELIKKLNSYSFSTGNLENQQTAVRALIKLERLYAEYYRTLKKDSGCISFSDCELMLLNKLREDEKFRKSLQDRFKYIIVDEFQDSNDIQAELFKLIGNDKLFYVGDIKQSIYAFRGGNPKIMAKLVEGKDGFNAVPLSINYRSRKTVLDVVNRAFSGLMTKEYGDVEYSDKDNLLEFGAEDLYPHKDGAADEKFVPVDTDKYCAEIHFISGDVNKDDEDMRQPRFVAKRIKELHDDPDFLITKNKERVRPTYSDFFVLLRNKAKVLEYRKAFSELDIPLVAPKGKNFLQSEEIELMLNLLSVIDNPLRNEDMLKVLMSPIYRFTAEEVTDIRLGLLGVDKSTLTAEQKKRIASIYRSRSLYKCLKDCCQDQTDVCIDKEKDEILKLTRNVPEKLAEFMSDLKNFRYYMSANSLHKLVCKIYEDTDAELIAAVFQDSAQRVANIRQFRDMAADFEQHNGGSLGDFLRFVDRVKSNESQKVDDATRPEDSMDAVQIMSFHASKGLEAPICILCELNDTVANYDYTGTFLHNRENYLALKNVDYKNRVKSNSFAYSALKAINRKCLCCEELRVLYVALTRAQEKLIMVTEKDYASFASSVLDLKNPEDTFNSDVSFEWILQSLARYPITGNKFNDFNCVLFDDKYDGAAPAKADTASVVYEVPEETAEALNSKINFRYAHLEDTERQEKYSVTDLAHRNSDAPINLAEPDFINKKLTGADKGNAYHHCMQYISFDKFKNPENDEPIDIAKSEIDRLSSFKRLNEREAKSIEPEKIAEFFTSDLGQRALAADKTVREEEFLAEVLGSEIAEDDLLDILLQGRVDMYFVENGEIVVVDYKTDNKENFEQQEEYYAKQVKIYSNVLKKLKGMNVKEIYLYSFENGKAINIK